MYTRCKISANKCICQLGEPGSVSCSSPLWSAISIATFSVDVNKPTSLLAMGTAREIVWPLIADACTRVSLIDCGPAGDDRTGCPTLSNVGEETSADVGAVSVSTWLPASLVDDGGVASVVISETDGSRTVLSERRDMRDTGNWPPLVINWCTGTRTHCDCCWDRATDDLGTPRLWPINAAFMGLIRGCVTAGKCVVTLEKGGVAVCCWACCCCCSGACAECRWYLAAASITMVCCS